MNPNAIPMLLPAARELIRRKVTSLLLEDDDDEQYDNDAHDVVRSSVTQPDIRWL